MSEHLEEIISAYLDQELNESEQKLVEEHLKKCPECRAMADDLKSLKGQIYSFYHSVDIPENIEQKVMAKINPINSKEPWEGMQPGFAAASLFLTISLFGLLLFMILRISMLSILFRLFKAVPVLITGIPYLSVGLIMFALFLFIISAWSLKLLLLHSDEPRRWTW